MKKKIKFAVILFIILSSIYLLNTTKSRYLSEMNLSDDVQVAIPIIALDETGSTITVDAMFPGDSTEYEFYVNNYDNTGTNEVLMTYYINITTEEQTLPLTYTVYSISGTTETELSYTTQGYGPVTLNYDQQESNHFKIVFTWSEDDNSASYAGKVFTFQVAINATQVV